MWPDKLIFLKHFEVHSKIGQKIQKLLIYLPSMQNLPYLICFKIFGYSVEIS